MGVTNNATVGGTLGVTSNATVGGTFGVTGASTLDSVGVTNNATVGGTLGVTGASTLDSVGVTNNATVGGTLGVTGASTLDSVGVTNNATVGGTFDVTDATTLSSTLSVAKAATLSSTLDVTGASTFSGSVDVCGNFYAQYPDFSIPVSALIGGATVDTENDISLNANLAVAGDVSFNSGMYLSGSMGINSSPNDDIVLDINATNAIRLPKGNNSDRPVQNDADASYKGLIRYNSEQDQFEGFGAGQAWGSLGGVKDVDQDTYITAETSAGADNDQLQFYTAGTERMIIDSDGDASFNNGINVMGTANMESTLVVDGDASLNSNLFVGGDLSLNGDLTIQGNLAVFQTTNTMAINTTVNNYEVIITNDLSLNGDMIVSGDASFNKDVYIGGNATISDNLEVDTMKVNGVLTVSGDILPTTGNVINLGSADKPFGGLYVSNNTIHFAGTDSGALSFQEGGLKIQSGEGEEEQSQDILAVSDGKVAIGKASSTATANLDVSGTMVVTDDVEIKGDLSANYVHASIPNSSLEEPFYHVEYTPIGGIIIWNNASIIPPGYTICDGRTVNDLVTPDLRGKFVIGYDASNSHLNQVDNSGGSFIIEDGDLPAYQYQFENEDISEYLLGGTPVIDASYSMPYYVMIYIMRTSNVISDVAALQRNSDISLNFHLAVGRSTTLRSTLDVSGATSFNSTFDVSGATTLNYTLDVSDNVIFNSGLMVHGDASFNSGMDVSDNVIFNSHLMVHGDASFNSGMDVSDNATFNSVLILHGDASLNSTLNVADNATLNSDLILHGDASLNSNLFVGGDLSLNGDLTIQGNLAVFQTTNTVSINTTVNNYEVIITNDMSLNGNMNVSGATTIGSTLDISGATIMDSTLTVNGDVSFNSSRVDICGNFYAQYPDNSIPVAAIVGDLTSGGGSMSSSSILAQF